MNFNKVFLIGNLTRDPELRSLPSGQSVINFGMATNRMWKDKEGQRKQQVEFHNIVAFGKLADTLHQYLHKGGLVCVEGRLTTRSWDAQDGTKRSKTEIIAETIQLGPRQSGSGGQAQSQSAPRESALTPPHDDVATVEYPEDEVNPDEIPF